MEIITTYHIRFSYPTRERRMQSREEIKEVIELAEELYNDLCKIFEIYKIEVME
jgi:hypothetical protein